MDLHYPTVKLKTPLTAAIDRGNVKILETLLDECSAGSLDSTTTQPCGKTALMYASYVTRHSDIIRVLIERGADVHKVDMLSIFTILLDNGNLNVPFTARHISEHPM